eukprot:80496-Amphidinium_carterae.3
MRNCLKDLNQAEKTFQQLDVNTTDCAEYVAARASLAKAAVTATEGCILGALQSSKNTESMKKKQVENAFKQATNMEKWFQCDVKKNLHRSVHMHGMAAVLKTG